MRRLCYFVASTVDGFIARKNGSFDFFPMTGEHLPYIAAEFPETFSGPHRAALGMNAGNAHFDTVLMGRNTYEVGVALGITSPYPHLRQYVVSRSMPASPDPAISLVSRDPVQCVRELKREEGLDIWLCGGARLAGALYDQIDRLIVKVNPVVLGDGIPLFEGVPGPTTLALTDHKTFAGGVAIHWYDVVR